GLTVSEQSLTRSELYIADEAFLTGTAAEIIPIASVDDRPTGSAGCGPLTARLRDAFHDVVRGRNPAYRHWLEYVGSSASESACVTDRIATLEEAVSAQAAAAAAAFGDDSPAAVALREEAADRAVDLIVARAWQVLPAASHGPAQAAAERCISYTV